MAARNLTRNVGSYVRDMVVFIVGGTGAADAALTSLRGPVASIARTAEGVYTITLDDKFTSVAAIPAVENADESSPALCAANVASISASSKTIVVNTYVAGTQADLTTDMKLRVAVYAVNSSVPNGDTLP